MLTSRNQLKPFGKSLIVFPIDFSAMFIVFFAILLHWAAFNGHDKVVEALLKAGADIEAKTPLRLDVGPGIGQPTMAMRRWLKRPSRPEPRSMPRTCVE